MKKVPRGHGQRWLNLNCEIDVCQAAEVVDGIDVSGFRCLVVYVYYPYPFFFMNVPKNHKKKYNSTSVVDMFSSDDRSGKMKLGKMLSPKRAEHVCYWHLWYFAPFLIFCMQVWSYCSP